MQQWPDTLALAGLLASCQVQSVPLSNRHKITACMAQIESVRLISHTIGDKTMPKILLTNNFHDTEAYVRPVLITEGRFKGYYKVSQSTAKRLHNLLCGVDGCTCGDTFGSRGGPYIGDTFGSRGGPYIEVINQDYNGNYIVQLHIGED